MLTPGRLFDKAKTIALDMKIKNISILTCLLMFASSVDAYKVEVHAILTDTAARRSVLSNSNTWRQYGFNSIQTSLPITPYEPESGALEGHSGIWDDMQDVGRYGDRRVVGDVHYAKLMAFGADIEDTGIEFILEGEPNNVFLSRAFNHFFNPQNNTKLGLTFLIDNHTSPDWMLEEPSFIGKQHFSYRDAQEHFYRVFTSGSASARESAMAETLQTLGHVVHHIQDMAQPQHTRLDSHCDAGFCQGFLDEYFSHDQNDTSIYEVYTQNIIRCEESGNQFTYGLAGAYRSPNSSPVEIRCDKDDLLDWDSDWVTQTIELNSYPVVDANNLVSRTPTPRDFWTNESGTGMADFSSRNFVSTDTAFELQDCIFGLTCDPDDIVARLRPHSSDLPLPNGQNDANYVLTQARLNDLIELPSQIPNDYGEGMVSFISSSFTDPYNSQMVTNERLVSYSMFNERFTKKSHSPLGHLFGVRIFTTNYFNMDAHAKLLMPRAVAYSAGMINYFFRYDLNYSRVRFEQDPDSSVAPLKATVRVTNNSEYDLSTSRHDILVQRNNGSFRTVDFGGSITIAAGAYRDFEINWRDYDHTGKVSIVFYDRINSTEGIADAAEAGLMFDLNLPEEPVTTIPCGNSVNASVGSEGYNATMDLGTESGPVVIQFEAFSIPDGLRVRNSSGSTRFSTGGLVSGYHTRTVNYDGDTDGHYNINVTGNSDSGTAWTLFVGCPNEGSSGSDIERHRFNFHYNEDSFDYACTGSLIIDGVEYDSAFDNIYLTEGDHSITATQSCSCRFLRCDLESIDGQFAIDLNFWRFSDLENGRTLHVNGSGRLSLQ